jgi:hypothetical protein
MGDMNFRDRERLVLWSGAAAASLLALVLLTFLMGTPVGRDWTRISTSVLLLYLCARIYGHARTLAERGVNETLARLATPGAAVLLLVLLVQAWSSRLQLRIGIPEVGAGEITAWTRLEWTGDVAVFALFLVTGMAVWIHGGEETSRIVALISNLVVGFFTLDLFGGVWGVWSLASQWRLLGSLFVLSLLGTLLVAIARRIERLGDEDPPEPPELLGVPDAPPPGFPVLPTPGAGATAGS